MKSVYFDNAATTEIDARVLKKMLPFLKEKYGNASSVHSLGIEARKAVEESRKIIADKIHARKNDIVFTSGGTEGNNLILKGVFFWASRNNGKNHIITTKIEHDSVLECCEWLKNYGAKITYLDVDENGFVDLKELEKSITDKTILVSVIHGNNEIGTIQNLKDIGNVCKRKKVLFHTDACQSFCKVVLNSQTDHFDFATLNAHKIHGPKGVGAVYVNEKVKDKIVPLIQGGGQEFNMRSGTENVSGIVGFGEAVKISSMNDSEKMEKLRDYFISKLEKVEGVYLNGTRKDRLCNNINFFVDGVEGEVLVSYLDAKGIFISAGSACSSNKEGVSHVLLAIGRTKKEVESSVRLSLSKFSTKKEVDFVLKEMKKVIQRLRN